MYLCYIDESGTSSIPGNTSHFVLAGLSIPIWHWTTCENEINAIKQQYNLESAEIHTGWLLRNYTEQNKIPAFASLPFQERRYAVEKIRKTTIIGLQKSQSRKLLQQTKKNYAKTTAYIHLTANERLNFVEKIAQKVGSWGFARLFAEGIDKIHFDPERAPQTVDEQAFEQIVSRYEQFLGSSRASDGSKYYGLLIHDNNETVAKKHTELMKSFHNRGTFWTKIESIIETPLFVSSQLTSMVQIADVCAYALRRYLENGEESLFECIFKRAHKKGSIVVGIRHFTDKNCNCKICVAHRPSGGVA